MMILWHIHIASVIFSSRNGAYHGNVAEDCEHTKHGGSHFSVGNVSRRQQSTTVKRWFKRTYVRLGEVVQRQNAVRGMWNRAFGWGMSVESDGVVRTQPGLYRFWEHRPTLAKNTFAVVVSSPFCLMF